MEEIGKVIEVKKVEDIRLEDKVRSIIEARKLFLDNIFNNKNLDNGYNTVDYDVRNSSLELLNDGLLNIGGEGLFISWVHFFSKIRGEDSKKQKLNNSPYSYQKEESWYNSYSGIRANSRKESSKIIPKWNIIVDSSSKEKMVSYLFTGSYLYQRNEENTNRSHYYDPDDKDLTDIIELNRPVSLFFDDRGIPNLYILSLSGSSSEVMSNKLDENFVLRVDDFDINYFNNLFLVLGGIYFSSSDNKNKLIEIAERTGSSTFYSLIKSFDNVSTKEFYASFKTFSKKFLDLKKLVQNKNAFVNRFINILTSGTKSFRRDRTVYYRLSSTHSAFVPMWQEREYEIREIKDILPYEISIRGNDVFCLYTSDLINQKSYLDILKNHSAYGKIVLTPTKKKFLIDFGEVCVKNAKEMIDFEYNNIELFSQLSKDIKNSADELNEFSNFLCKSFSSAIFLNVVDI